MSGHGGVHDLNNQINTTVTPQLTVQIMRINTHLSKNEPSRA